jgi:hypothetical protein
VSSCSQAPSDRRESRALCHLLFARIDSARRQDYQTFRLLAEPGAGRAISIYTANGPPADVSTVEAESFTVVLPSE